MARPTDLARRRELLDALITEFAARGIGDRSLRDVATAVGTSHRMLLHHFGSRDDLLVAIVEEVERRQRAVLHELPTDPAAGLAAMWADLRRPELRALERLFFECYARGAAGEQPFARMLPGAIDSWLAEVGRVEATAVAPADPAAARLGLAAIRGLLLDLVATNDEAGVDAAARAFVGLVRLVAVADQRLGITAPIIVSEDPECRFYRGTADAVAAGISNSARVFDATGQSLVVEGDGLVVAARDPGGAAELAGILRNWLGYVDAIRWSVADMSLPWLVKCAVEHLGYSG